jgi:peptidoglycan/xylan/chitin deacetylase (PgdA/CDA1 family)
VVVLRVGPELRRWLAVGAAGAVVVGLLRWGFQGSPGIPPLAGAAASTSAASAGTAAVQEAVVALTVDAPDGALIEGVTRALSAAGLPATVFVAQGYAAAHPAALRILTQEGDEIEVLADPSGATLSAASRLVASATGQAPIYARLPGGTPQQSLLSAAHADSLAVVAPGQEALTVTQLQDALRPGAVLTIPPTFAPDVPALATTLRAHSYQAVTLEALGAIMAGAAATSLPTVP